MAKASQTETAVLGALSVMPMTGYAIREAIRDVLGHFWSESFGQIYPTLAELERQGYVRRQGSNRTRSSRAVTRFAVRVKSGVKREAVGGRHGDALVVAVTAPRHRGQGQRGRPQGAGHGVRRTQAGRHDCRG
jgi:Transcriptional regulator PadR-like family